MCKYCEKGLQLPREYCISQRGLRWTINDRDKCLQGDGYDFNEEEVSMAYCFICGRKLSGSESASAGQRSRSPKTKRKIYTGSNKESFKRNDNARAIARG